MERKIQILRHLYGEEPDWAALQAHLEDDEALRQEYQALSEAKFYLDQRRRERPDPRVIDAVMAAAGASVPEASGAELSGVDASGGSTARGRREDRPPVGRRLARRFRTLSVAGTLLLALAGVGLLQMLPLTPPPAAYRMVEALPESAAQAGASGAGQEAMLPPAASAPFAQAPAVEAMRPDREEAGEGLPYEGARTVRPEVGGSVPLQVHRTEPGLGLAAAGRSSPAGAPALADRLAAEPVRAGAASGPARVALRWDEADDVRRLHRRIGVLEARSSPGAWDAPAYEAGAGLMQVSRPQSRPGDF